MPDEPGSAPETSTQDAPATTPATTEVVATPNDASPAPTPESSPGSADDAASPAAKEIDVHAGLMAAATAAVKKTARGDPSAPGSQGNSQSADGGAPAKAGTSAADGAGAKPGAPAAASQVKPNGAAKPDQLDESTPPPFHDHPRWKKLTRDFQETARERDELRAPADQYRKITDYMRAFEITTDDMVVAYDLIARIKHDPISAYERLKPIFADLAKRAGVVMPDDLQRKVDEGYMDEESARELAQTRVREKLAQDQAAREAKRGTDTQVGAVIERNRTAAASWESEKIAKDPDFERKRSAVQDAARAILAQEGQPKNPQEAVAVLERAYKRVNDLLAGYGPKPTATPRQPNGAASPSSATVTTPPKSLLEAAKQGLQGNYRFGPN